MERFAFIAACVSVLASAASAIAAGPATRPAEVPPSRGGQDLVGKRMPELAFDRWVGTPAGKPLDTAGKVTLYRWWTNTCPYCESSLPAIEALRARYATQGFQAVAVYHPKPPRDVKDAVIARDAERIGYRGPIAVDLDWSVLRDLYLSTGKRGATSASFLVDRAGVIRYVHPGPDFFPSADPAEARQNDDHAALERAIETLLAEGDPAPATRPALPRADAEDGQRR